MATKLPAATQAASPAPNTLTMTIPTSITVKDVVVIITAIVTVVSSWTFYTMRLSVQENKLGEYKAQIEKVQTDVDSIHKDIIALQMRTQALEIRQSIPQTPSKK